MDEGSEPGRSSSRSSVESGSLCLEYSRSSFEGSSSNSDVEERAGGGVVEPYQYEPLEGRNSSSPRSSADDEGREGGAATQFRLVRNPGLRLSLNSRRLLGMKVHVWPLSGNAHAR